MKASNPSILTNKWVWLVMALAVGFLVYHAPRLAISMPI